jgi:hypothetical protein
MTRSRCVSIGTRITIGLACAGLSLAASAVAAADGWSLVLLQPSGAEASEVWGGAAGVQVGMTRIAGKTRAASWRGSAATWMDHDPPGSVRSMLYATDGARLVGDVLTSETRYSLYIPTPVSPGVTFQRGVIFGTAGGQQVGQLLSGSFMSTSFSAVLWTGTPESMVTLAPTSSSWNIYTSMARATDGVQQVGSVGVLLNAWTGQSVQFASLWSGTASSWVPLSFTESEAVGVHNGVQVGWTAAGVTNPRFACLWRGTKESIQGMHPAAATSSVLVGVLDNHQVGAAQFGGRWKAGIWSGTPESFENLDALVPTGFTGSWASSIWRDGDRLYVGGVALRDNGWPYQDNNQAVLWWRTVGSACPGDMNNDTIVNDSDFQIFAPAYDILDCTDPVMPVGCPADLNKDGVVDDADFSIFVVAYDELVCP